MNRIDRNRRMQHDILAGYTVGWVHGEDNVNPSLHDEEGNFIAELRPDMVDVLDRTNDVDALTMILTLAQSCQLVDTRSFDRGFKIGKLAGRDDLVNTVHMLLGIDRIVNALERSDAHV